MKKFLGFVFMFSFLLFACNNEFPAENECGDGYLFAGELCDDGNLIEGDGCSSACEVEENWLCLLEGHTSKCSPPCREAYSRCRDGVKYSCQNGVWDAGVPCPDNYVCDVFERDCTVITVCADGTEQCKDNTLAKCEHGEWVKGLTCPEDFVCDISQTKCVAPDACLAGEKKCEYVSEEMSSYEYECDNLRWKRAAMCQNGEICDQNGIECADPVKSITLLPHELFLTVGERGKIDYKIELQYFPTTPSVIASVSSDKDYCVVNNDSFSIDGLLKEGSVEFEIADTAKSGESCTISIKAGKLEEKVSIKVVECEVGEKKCGVDNGLIYTCGEDLTFYGKSCDYGMTCPVGENECKDIKIVGIEPQELLMGSGDTIEVTLTLNYPVYDPAFKLNLTSEFVISGDDNFEVSIPTEVFSDNSNELSFKVNAKGVLSASSFKVHLKDQENLDLEISSITVNYDSTNGCSDDFKVTGYSYLRVMCVDKTRALSFYALGTYFDEMHGDVSSDLSIDPANPLSSSGAYVIGKYVKFDLLYAPSYKSIEFLLNSNSTDLVFSGAPNAASKTITFMPGTRFMPFSMLYSPTNQQNIEEMLSLEVTSSDTPDFKLDFRFEPCVPGGSQGGSESDTRCIYTGDSISSETCSGNTWNSSGLGSSQNCPNQTCSLFNSNCEERQLSSAYPQKMLIFKNDASMYSEVKVVLNGKLPFTSTAKKLLVFYKDPADQSLESEPFNKEEIPLDIANESFNENIYTYTVNGTEIVKNLGFYKTVEIQFLLSDCSFDVLSCFAAIEVTMIPVERDAVAKPKESSE